MSSEGAPEVDGYPSGRDEDRVAAWLRDLAGFGDDAAYLLSLGREDYDSDDANGRMLRNAAERLLIKVATVVERLPGWYKDRYPDVPWTSITRMRNLVAQHDDKVNHDLMWVTLERDVPALIERLDERND